MGNKEILFKKLDEILNEMFKYSLILGNIGKYVWIEIYIRDDGYNGRSFVIKPSKIQVFKYLNICNECREDIYVSEYSYINNSYNIYPNTSIRNVRKNIREMKKLISNIETQVRDVYNIIVNSYLDPSRIYPKLLIYFRRDISNGWKIFKEIRDSIIFGHTASEKIKFNEQPVFRFIALEEKKTGDLFYPKNYRFSFMVYG
jgi:hypothetical protein